VAKEQKPKKPRAETPFQRFQRLVQGIVRIPKGKLKEKKGS